MEGSGGDFKQNSDQHQSECGKYKAMILCGGSETRNLVNLRCSSCSEDERYSIEKESGGKGAEQEVFNCCFRSAAGLFAIAGQHIGGNGRNFECDENDEQFDGPSQQAHPYGA